MFTLSKRRLAALLFCTFLAVILAGPVATANGLDKKSANAPQSAVASPAATELPVWTPRSTEYTRVQSGDWLDSTQFAVGRWDGTLSVFRVPKAGEYTPVLVAVHATSQGDGVEMVTALGDGAILASNTASQIILWQPGAPGRISTIDYDAAYGVANAGAVFQYAGRRAIVTGHANGYVVIWTYTGSKLTQEMAVDVRSPEPIPSPYPIKNIRSIAHWRDNLVIAGSEDGDLTIIDVGTGKIVARQRYNPAAKRGVNNISVNGDLLLIANCSVGKADRNLWLYRVSTSGFELLDAINLIEDTNRPQSFNFDADLAVASDGTLRFFASTEEGLLWGGTVVEGKLVVQRKAKVAADGGAFLDIQPDGGGILLAGARKLYLFAFP